MKSKLVLLLTHDSELEEQSIETVSESGARLVVARNVAEAIEIVCLHGANLDLVIIDFDNGCRGMTLLSALNLLRRHLPIIAITSVDREHTAAVAYENGVSACLTKPINSVELEIMVRALVQPALELQAA